MPATVIPDSTKASPRHYLAFELGWSQWKVGFARGLDVKPWRRAMAARDLLALEDAAARARHRFERPNDVPDLTWRLKVVLKGIEQPVCRRLELPVAADVH